MGWIYRLCLCDSLNKFKIPMYKKTSHDRSIPSKVTSLNLFTWTYNEGNIDFLSTHKSFSSHPKFEKTPKIPL